MLTDLGSLARIGETTSSTSVFLPLEICSREASAQVDWWMLAVVFCDKMFKGRIGEDATSRLTKIEILNALAGHHITQDGLVSRLQGDV